MACMAAYMADLALRVSISSASTPDSMSADICWRYASVSVSHVSVSCPPRLDAIDSDLLVGPMLAATHRVVPGLFLQNSSTASRANMTAVRLISSVLCPKAYSASDNAFELNVLAQIMSAPASKYALWMSRRICGAVSDSTSLHPARLQGWSANTVPRKSASERWYDCIMVPMAPSSTSTRSRTASASLAGLPSYDICLISCRLSVTVMSFLVMMCAKLAKKRKNAPTHHRAGTFLLIYITFYIHTSVTVSVNFHSHPLNHCSSVTESSASSVEASLPYSSSCCERSRPISSLWRDTRIGIILLVSQ